MSEEEEETFHHIGMTVAGDLMVEPPAEGEHLWVIQVFYRVKPKEMIEDGLGVRNLFVDLTRKNMVMAGDIGCVICDRSYKRAKDEPCPGRSVDQ